MRFFLAYILLTASVLMISSASADSGTAPLRLANAIIPASFAAALKEGLAVPVYLQYYDHDKQIASLTAETIGNAILLLKGEQLFLLYIDFSASQKQGLLNERLITILSNEEMRGFSSEGTLQINENASMQLDLIAMKLTIQVSREAFGYAKQEKRSIALTSSVDTLTGVHRYNLGYSFSDNQYRGRTESNFFQMGSTLGFGANHLVADMSLYNIGQSNQNGDIYRIMYERDFEDRRLAAGMVSTWDLQTLGVVTALNTGRIFGASYSNQAKSRQVIANESATPIQVFMPSNGEVRVYRDERLIGLQNLSIGNQSIDTSAFPNGIYNVKVEVYVDGRLVDSTNQRVTKLGGRQNFTQEWGWQWWGGVMEGNEDNAEYPIAGLSLARNIDALDLATSMYVYPEASIGEARLGWQATERLNLQVQTMISSDSSWRMASSLSFQLHDNVSVWFSQEKLTTGNILTVGETDLVGAGFNINLSGWMKGLGQLTFNTTHDSQIGSYRSYVDYSQHIYSGRYGNLSLRASLQSDDSRLNSFNNKSMTLDYSIPLDSLFNLGVSSNERGQTTANLGYQKRLDSVVNLASFNASRIISGSDEHKMALSGTLGFDNRAMGGTMTMGRGHAGDLSGNLIARGTLATTNKSVVPSSQSVSDAGIVIATGIDNGGQMLAKVNGQDYPLQDKEVFLSLQPYQEYEIELLNSKTSKDSYNINAGKLRYTLFPGNVATLDASDSIKEMVTVFGIIRAEDGSVLANARLDNHVGTTVTDDAGEFSLDVDKANPILTFRRGIEFCEAELDIAAESGAAWVGNIICMGLKSYAVER